MSAPLKDSVVVFLVMSGDNLFVFNGLTKERKFITVFIALDLSVGVFSGRSCRRQLLNCYWFDHYSV